MFDKGANKQPKREAAVSVVLVDGERFDGFVYLKHDERLVDLLNDKRAFIPFKRDDDGTVIIAKSSISCLNERDRPKAANAEKTGDTPSDETMTDAGVQPAPPNQNETAQGAKSFAEPPNDMGRDDTSSPRDDDQGDDDQGDGATCQGGSDDGAAASASDKTTDDGKTDRDEADSRQSEQDTARRARKRTDLYKVLRISPDASLEEIRTAYKTRMKAVHPDTLIGQNVDEEKKRAALQATQLVNRAYRAILAEREREAGENVDESDQAAV
ncbi:MAG: J domain-containing protein [Pseudomonadota bacterium]